MRCLFLSSQLFTIPGLNMGLSFPSFSLSFCMKVKTKHPIVSREHGTGSFGKQAKRMKAVSLLFNFLNFNFLLYWRLFCWRNGSRWGSENFWFLVKIWLATANLTPCGRNSFWRNCSLTTWHASFKRTHKCFIYNDLLKVIKSVFSSSLVFLFGSPPNLLWYCQSIVSQ